MNEAPHRTIPMLAWAMALLPHRSRLLTAQPLTIAILKDLGLSRSDLPAICMGSFAQDDTRRHR